MKRLFIIVVVAGLAAALSAQSLTELAKKEKARRESLKGRHAVVIRNIDLLRVQKLPAVEVTPPEPERSEDVAAEGAAGETETAAGEAGPASLPSGSGAPGRRIVPKVASPGPVITGDVNRDQSEGGGTLEAQLQAVKETVDLLTTKMNALRQQLESQDAMVPGYVIQQQLDETNQRLLKAQAQQARIEDQINRKAAARKSPGGPER
jgi:hypothetical protein